MPATTRHKVAISHLKDGARTHLIAEPEMQLNAALVITCGGSPTSYFLPRISRSYSPHEITVAESQVPENKARDAFLIATKLHFCNFSRQTFDPFSLFEVV